MTKSILFLLIASILLPTVQSAKAQQPRTAARIAILAYNQQRSNMEEFFEELNRLGHIADQNTRIDLWNAEGRTDRLTELAEVVRRFKPDVILASATPAALAAKKAMPTTPIVFALVADPVSVGLVTSFANPGGYVTGLTNMNVELSGKRAELLMETFPMAKRIGVLSNPADPITAPQLNEISRTVRAAKRNLEVLDASNPKDLQELPASLTKNRLDAMTLISSQLFAGHRTELVSMAIKTKTPVIYWTSAFVSSGGLMSYGVNVPELYRRAAFYVDRILKGAKPAELPVEQPKTFEFLVNLKTAMQIGITIPPNVLVRADKVIR